MNLGFLKTFVTLARERSFTRTAQVLHMTQPGVSQHVGKLEEHFGLPLVDRAAPGFRLTEAGLRLAEHGAKLLEDAANLALLVAEDSPWEGECRFASPGSFGIKMYSFLLEVNREHRGLVIHYVYRPNDVILEQVLRGQTDVGFVTVEPGSPELEARAVDEERLCLVVPRGARVGSAQDLVELGFVGHPDGNHQAGRLLEANFPEVALAQVPLRAFNNQITRILEPVALGLGFTALPEGAVNAFCDPAAIEVVDLPVPVVDTIWAVHRRGRILPRRFGFLLDAFAARSGAPSAGGSPGAR